MQTGEADAKNGATVLCHAADSRAEPLITRSSSLDDCLTTRPEHAQTSPKRRIMEAGEALRHQRQADESQCLVRVLIRLACQSFAPDVHASCRAACAAVVWCQWRWGEPF